ncbi:hypothetical protein NA56DRAFT_433146 [Hyaloscypha hepaticicola]|uniref:Secreted protein n=1 Tax=Hyaloscypha hepaticicola TaxID=2082293 RepID=A0A2J6QGH7_9HELO|nr:hypothetical protein NA56DRAFT_433146 [Hyaloscypha hepaticicola]
MRAFARLRLRLRLLLLAWPSHLQTKHHYLTPSPFCSKLLRFTCKIFTRLLEVKTEAEDLAPLTFPFQLWSKDKVDVGVGWKGGQNDFSID